MVSCSKPTVPMNWSFPRWSAPASFSTRSSGLFQRYYSAVVLMVVLLAMTGVEATAEEAECIADGKFDADTDYFPHKVNATEANHWVISYHKSYKIITNTDFDETYVLTQCGAPQPEASLVPANAKHFSIPLTRVAVDETVGATMIELLGLRPSIKYMNTDWVTSPCLNKMAADGDIEFFNGKWDNATMREAEIADVQAVFSSYAASENPKIIPFGAAQDPGAMARVEWIKLLSAFFNRELLGEVAFESSHVRFQCQSEHAKAASLEQKRSPIVAWVQYESWKVSCGTPPFSIQTTPYKKDYTEAAGGEFFTNDVNDFETSAELLKVLEAADVIIDETYKIVDMDGLMASFPGLTEDDAKRWWRNDRLYKPAPGDGAASDWFESVFPEPDVALEDLISIVHPNLNPNHQRSWYRHASEPRVIVTTQCQDVNERLKLKHDGCVSAVKCDECVENFQAKGGCDTIQTENTKYLEGDVDNRKMVMELNLMKLECGTCAFDLVDAGKQTCEKKTPATDAPTETTAAADGEEEVVAIKDATMTLTSPQAMTETQQADVTDSYCTVVRDAASNDKIQCNIEETSTRRRRLLAVSYLLSAWLPAKQIEALPVFSDPAALAATVTTKAKEVAGVAMTVESTPDAVTTAPAGEDTTQAPSTEYKETFSGASVTTSSLPLLFVILTTAGVLA